MNKSQQKGQQRIVESWSLEGKNKKKKTKKKRKKKTRKNWYQK